MNQSAPDQHRRAAAFQALHEGPEPFVVPNPWDAGTARVLSGLGFAALATTGAGLAHSRGLPDNLLTREDLIDNAAAIVEATPLPVTADLESGFGDSPDDVAETIRRAAAAGLVGGSIEDSTGLPDDPIRPLEEAEERVRAAVAAAEDLGFPFTVTARAENFFQGRPHLADTIRRLQAYEAAGAHVLYAPALPDAGSIRTVCSSVSRPVNVLMGPAPQRAGTRRPRRPPHQRRLGALPRGARRRRPRRPGDPRPRHLHLRRGRDPVRRSRRDDDAAAGVGSGQRSRALTRGSRRRRSELSMAASEWAS